MEMEQVRIECNGTEQSRIGWVQGWMGRNGVTTRWDGDKTGQDGIR